MFSICFYIFFVIYDGVVLCADSGGYIENSLAIEFFYPALLDVFNVLFGENYLLFVVLLQSLLAAFAAWKVAVYFRNRFSMGYLTSSIVFLLPIFVSCLNRFVAKRGTMYSNSILSEGLAIPLFMLFFCYLFDYLNEHSRKSFLVAVILSGILVAIRKQMYVTLILLFLVYLYVQMTSLTRKEEKQMSKCIGSVAKAIAICMVVLVSVSLLDSTYNYLVRGRFVGHSSDNRFVLTMVFYTAEEEYIEELPEDIQPLFADIYETCDEQGYLMHSAGNGWYNNVAHFGANYDFIQLDTMWPAIKRYVDEHYTADRVDRELLTDEITNKMIVSLLPKTAPKIIKVLCNNFLDGMVTTVAQRNRILTFYSIVAYVGYIGLLGVYWKKVNTIDNTIKLCLLTLLSIVINVGLVSAVIFCQTRYTIYNMPLFYISGVILLNSMWKKITNNKD